MSSARNTLLALGLAGLALIGCRASWGPGVPARSNSATARHERDLARCVRRATGPNSPYRLPLADEESDPALARHLDEIPAGVRRTVRAAGLEPALARLLRDRASGAPAVEIVARRLAIATHLQSLVAQLAATAFEADCTDDLLEARHATIEQDINTREIQWTIASLVVGAAGAVGAGTWELVDPDGPGSSIVGLAGGLAAGALGLVAFIEPAREIVLPHRRNLLAPIARGRDPEFLYPTFVFRMLTLPLPDGTTPRAALLARFDEILAGSVEAEERARAEALLFGDGGTYDIRLLEAREKMLDELESTISAFGRDLEILDRFLGRTLDGACLGASPDVLCAPSP